MWPPLRHNAGQQGRRRRALKSRCKAEYRNRSKNFRRIQPSGKATPGQKCRSQAFRNLSNLYHKPAVVAIRGKRAFEADQVQRVTVRLAPPVAAVVDNRDIPDICLQHMIAVMLLDKTVSFHSAHDKPRMKDPAVLGQRVKVAGAAIAADLAGAVNVRQKPIDAFCLRAQPVQVGWQHRLVQRQGWWGHSQT